MKKLLLIILSFICTVSFTYGQSTKRKLISPVKQKSTPVTNVSIQNDTITEIEQINAIVEISGFKKAVASRVESVMLKNLNCCDTINAVVVDIDYRTPKGQQLNRRTVTFNAIIPPGETRHVSVPSWDRQQLFYHVNTPPVKKTQRTTPFTVTIVPQSILLSPKK